MLREGVEKRRDKPQTVMNHSSLFKDNKPEKPQMTVRIRMNESAAAFSSLSVVLALQI